MATSPSRAPAPPPRVPRGPRASAPVPVALSTRTIARIFFTVIGLAAILYLAYLVRSVIGLLLIAVFLSVALGPAVDFWQRRRLPRGAAILVVYLGLIASVFLIGLLVVPPVVTQVQQLAEDLPGYIDDLRDNETLRRYDDQYNITDALQQQAQTLPRRLASAASTLQAVTVGALSAIVQVITVLTITFFLLLDGRRILEFLFGLAGGGREERLRAVASEIFRAVSGFVSGALVLALMAGTTTWITLTILGVPFSVPLAILMGFLDLIPLVGATIGGVIILLVTLFHDFPTAAIVWAIVFLVYQQLENNLLQPQVYKRTVNVAPLVVIVAILVGATLLGVLGALVAIPAAATIQIIVRDLWAHRRGHVELPERLEVEAPPGTAASTPNDLILP